MMAFDRRQGVAFKEVTAPVGVADGTDLVGFDE